jgi:hypothetical protein
MDKADMQQDITRITFLIAEGICGSEIHRWQFAFTKNNTFLSRSDLHTSLCCTPLPPKQVSAMSEPVGL